jgi:hypothetical protein
MYMTIPYHPRIYGLVTESCGCVRYIKVWMMGVVGIGNLEWESKK